LDKVDLYVESADRYLGKRLRWCGYLLSFRKKDGEEITRSEFSWEDGTYNSCIIQTMQKGLRRLKKSCEVHIHTQDGFALDMIKNYLKDWAKKGFQGKKDGSQWEEIWNLTKEHRIICCHGKHEYLSWMKGEMERKKHEEG